MLKRSSLFGIALLSLVVLLAASCSGQAPEPTTVPPVELKVNDTSQALDAALTYLREIAPNNAPTEDITWEEEDITPTGLVGASTKHFVSGQWEATVSYPVVLPANTIYTVTISSTELGWQWAGKVKADGTITETSPFQKTTKEDSRKVAEDFVRNSPTFVFDGIEATLELVETPSPDIENTWQFACRFESRHAGYGDRTGQMLAEVITPHEITIIVEGGKVTSAVMDEQWDMLQQKIMEEELPPRPPMGVPAAPNDSIVTAKVFDIINAGGDTPWEIVVEIQTSEDVPGFNNATKSRVGETITLKTYEDVSKLDKGQVITAHVQLRGDERSHFYEASEIK